MTHDDSTRSPRRLTALLSLLALLAIPAGAAMAQGESNSPNPSVDSVRRDGVETKDAAQAAGSVQMLEVAAPPAPAAVRANTATGGYGHFAPGAGAAMPSMKMGISTLSSATLGATVGGAQDIGFARRTIEAGQVPGFIDFSAEGLYSEHDIPTPSGGCDARLCLSLGYGFGPAGDDSSNALFVHLGMNSDIKADEFRRTPLQLAVVVDRSGSMEGESMTSVKAALVSLVGRLSAEDELVLIEFSDSARVILPATRVKDREAIIRRIETIMADGGTNIESGLTVGFEQLAALQERAGVSRRLMLFTDALPNVGRTDTTSFRALTERYARQGIGLTAFGVGLDFGHEIVYHISKLRGANYFYLETPEKIAKVFDREFDYLVTPLVYDLKVKIATPAGLRLKAVYGLPTWTPGSRDAELAVPTVFLSSNRGAIVLRYEREDGVAMSIDRDALLASGELSFTDTDGGLHRAASELRNGSGVTLRAGTQYYSHEGLRKAVALTNIYFGLRDGCRLFSEGKRNEALDAVARARGLASLENLRLVDGGLATEIALLERLTKNIEQQSAAYRTVDRDVKRSAVPR